VKKKVDAVCPVSISDSKLNCKDMERVLDFVLTSALAIDAKHSLTGLEERPTKIYDSH